MLNEHEMQTAISRAVVPLSHCVVPGRVTQHDGSEAGRPVQSGDPGFWPVDRTGKVHRRGCQRDMVPLRRVKSSGAEATWLREGAACSREGETEGGKQVGRVG